MCFLSKCNFVLSPSAWQQRRFGNSPFYAVGQAAYWRPDCRRRSLSRLAVALSQSYRRGHAPVVDSTNPSIQSSLCHLCYLYKNLKKNYMYFDILMYIAHCFLCIRVNILLIRFVAWVCELCVCVHAHAMMFTQEIASQTRV